MSKEDDRCFLSSSAVCRSKKLAETHKFAPASLIAGSEGSCRLICWSWSWIWPVPGFSLEKEEDTVCFAAFGSASAAFVTSFSILDSGCGSKSPTRLKDGTRQARKRKGEAKR